MTKIFPQFYVDNLPWWIILITYKYSLIEKLHISHIYLEDIFQFIISCFDMIRTLCQDQEVDFDSILREYYHLQNWYTNLNLVWLCCFGIVLCHLCNVEFDRFFRFDKQKTDRLQYFQFILDVKNNLFAFCNISWVSVLAKFSAATSINKE